MKKERKKLCFRVLVLVMVLGAFLGSILGTSTPTKVYASDKIGFLNEEPTNDVFSGAEAVIKDTGRSGVKLLRTVGIVCIGIAVLLVALKIIFLGKRGRDEGKDGMVSIALASALIFGTIGFVALFASLGESFKSMNNAQTPSPSPSPSPQISAKP